MCINLGYMDPVAKGGGGIEEFEVSCSHGGVSSKQTGVDSKHRGLGEFKQ